MGYLVIPQLRDDRAEYYGPFENTSEATEWAHENFANDWMIVPIRGKDFNPFD